MAPLNSRQELFAQLVASGHSATDAYRRAGYAHRAAETCGPRLLGNARVAARVRELQARQSHKAEMSRDEMRRYLVEVLLTPCGNVGPGHRLCVRHKATDNGVEVWMPDKLRAAELLIRLCGWAEPERINLDAGDGLAALISRIRAGRAPGAS
jgi:hypothetical protein